MTAFVKSSWRYCSACFSVSLSWMRVIVSRTLVRFLAAFMPSLLFVVLCIVMHL